MNTFRTTRATAVAERTVFEAYLAKLPITYAQDVNITNLNNAIGATNSQDVIWIKFTINQTMENVDTTSITSAPLPTNIAGGIALAKVYYSALGQQITAGKTLLTQLQKQTYLLQFTDIIACLTNLLTNLNSEYKALNTLIKYLQQIQTTQNSPSRVRAIINAMTTLYNNIRNL